MSHPCFTDCYNFELQFALADVLRHMPTASADVVYFDPMFRKAAKSASGFDIVRALAVADALSAEALAQAQRVARRSVIVMERVLSRAFAKVGSLWVCITRISLIHRLLSTRDLDAGILM